MQTHSHSTDHSLIHCHYRRHTLSYHYMSVINSPTNWCSPSVKNRTQNVCWPGGSCAQKMADVTDQSITGQAGVAVWGCITLRAPLSGTFLQTLPDLVTQVSKHDALPPQKPQGLLGTGFCYATEGALFISAQLSSDAVSALRKVRVLIWLEAT